MDSKYAKNAWKMMSVLKKLILEQNGMIFGGFVRDSIIHDHFAQLYYKHCLSNDIEYDVKHSQYSNPLFVPTTADRLIVPSDIDCFMTEAEYVKFFSSLKANRLFGKLLFKRNASNYINGFPHDDPTLSHRRIRVELNTSYLVKEFRRLPFNVGYGRIIHDIHNQSQPVYIDVITSERQYKEPFFTSHDFECNGLYMTSHGICLSSRLMDYCETSEYARFNKLNSIIKDIINKKAVYLHPVNTNNNIASRMEKLTNKGWVISDTYNVISSVNDDKYTGYCIICHDALPKSHFKLTCCCL